MAGFTPGSIVKMLKAEIPQYLGTYTYKDGSTSVAIAIDNVPNEVEVTGFEVIVPGYPKVLGGINRSGRRTHICQVWDLDFMNHDSHKVGSLARKGEFFEMIQTLALTLPRIPNIIPFNQTDPVRSIQRCRMSIKLSDTYDNRKPNS